MATIIIYPNANISAGIPTQYPSSGSHYDKLLSQDDASTYVACASGAGVQIDEFQIPAFRLGTINSVSLVSRCVSLQNNSGQSKTGLRIQGLSTIYWGTTQNPPTGWTTYTDTWYTDPSTGAAWTPASVASLSVCLGLSSNSGGWTIKCTQLYMVVDYTPYGTYQEVLLSGGSGYTTSATYVNFINALNDISSGNILRINAVSVFFKGYGAVDEGAGSYGKIALTTNSSTVYGTEYALPGDGNRTTFSQTWVTNPVTGVAWTKAEVNALQAGVALHARSGGWSATASDVTVVVHYTNDQAPNTPTTPSGVSTGAPGTSYSFAATASDPEGDNIYYTFDWGDGQTSNTGWLSSGQQGSASHSWATPAAYIVKVKATDVLGMASGWSGDWTVDIRPIQQRGAQLIGLTR